MRTIIRVLPIIIVAIVAFFLGKIYNSPPYIPKYTLAEPNYFNFYYWLHSSGRYALRDVLQESAVKFDRICVVGEGGIPPREVSVGAVKLAAGSELNDSLSMSYVSVYLLGDESYSVMNFDPIDFYINFPFSDCQNIDGLNLEILSGAENSASVVTYRID